MSLLSATTTLPRIGLKLGSLLYHYCRGTIFMYRFARIDRLPHTRPHQIPSTRINFPSLLPRLKGTLRHSRFDGRRRSTVGFISWILDEPYVFPTPDPRSPDLKWWASECTRRRVVANREDRVVPRDSHFEVFWNFESLSLSNGFVSLLFARRSSTHNQI